MSRLLLGLGACAPLCLAVGMAAPVRAEVRTGESIDVSPGEIVDGNLYGGAATVTIGGDVVGDVIVSGGTVLIPGHVHGDVLAMGSSVVVTGVVDGDIRAMGGTVSVSATTAGDVVLAGGTVTVAGRVGGDALIAGGKVTVSAPIARHLYLGGAEAHVSSTVGRDVVAAADHLVLEAGAVVGGNVDYTGSTLDQSPGAVVNGVVQHTAAESQARLVVRNGVVGWLQGFIGLGLFGALWLSLFRGFAQRAMDTVRDRFGLSLGVGLGAMFGAPVVLAVAFAVGIITGGWWISVFGGAIYAIAIAMTFPLVAAVVGRQFLMVPLRTTNELGPMLVVLLVQSLLGLVPVLGPLLNLAIILCGLGAIAVTLVPTMRKARLPAETSSTDMPLSTPA